MKKLYPSVKFVKTNGFYDQLKHVYSEVKEVIDEIDGSLEDLLMEICDLEHSIQTAFEIVEKKFGADIDAIRARVVEKNRKRGYYEG